MNISLARTKPTVKTLRQINAQLERIATALEVVVSHTYGYNVTPPAADTRGKEPELMYVDEELAALRELKERIEGEKEIEPETELEA